MNRPLIALLLAAMAFVALPGRAAEPSRAPATAAASEQTIPWTAIAGQAIDLAIGVDGAVFALDGDGRVWLRRPGATTPWVGLPGAFKRIAAASEKLAWAIDEAGALYAYNGTWWRPMGERYPFVAVDVGVSPGGVAFAISIDGKLVSLGERRGQDEVPDAPTKPVRIAVDDRDLPWTVAADGAIHRYDGRRWMPVDGLRARDIGAGAGGVWIIGLEGELVALTANGTPQRRIAARAAVVAPAPGGAPWIATADGRIYAANPDTSIQRGSQRTGQESVFTRLLNWQRVNGSARQLAISPTGAVLALGAGGELWQWKSRNTWGLLPGSFVRIALDSDSRPLGIDTTGRILRLQGGYWMELSGTARDIAAGADGSLWIVQADGTPALWLERQRVWQALAPAKAARRIAVTPDGKPWIVDANGAPFRFDGKEWIALPELDAIDLAIGPEGSVFATSNDKRLWRWDAAGKRWERLNGEASIVAVGPRGKPWIATADAVIYASAFFDDLPDSKVNTLSVAAATAKSGAGTTTASGVVGQPGIGGGAAKGSANDPLNYRKVTGAARDIAIGADGSVFVVTYDGGLARWSNTRNAFVGFAGQFSRIAVAPDGKPWGVTSRGEVYRHDGTLWQLVRNIVAGDIAVGFDGTVLVSGPQNVLYKYDAAGDTFVRLPAVGDNAPPAGVHVAVDPAGKPWVIGTDGFVARCGSGVCERLPTKARSIAIGPEGSVVIVDADRVLKRWSAREERFERIDGIADLLDLAAVGPRGKPWLLSTKSEVWSSEFFMRDESRDITTAAITATTISASSTTGISTPPAFTFLINMKFDAISLSGMATNAGDATAVAIEVNSAGNPVIIDYSKNFWTYNRSTKQLVKDTSVPSVPFSGFIRSFAIGKDGTYWLADGNSPYAVYRRQGSQWVQVTGLSDCSSSCNPATIAVGPDGGVYATSESGKLYRYDTALKRFVMLTLSLPGRLQFIGVDASNHFWAVSGDTSKIYEYTGTAWVSRNDSLVTSPDSCIDQTIKCFSIGANGSIYTVTSSGTNQLARWNATSRVWERISSSPTIAFSSNTYAVGPDGRPWVLTQGSPDVLHQVR